MNPTSSTEGLIVFYHFRPGENQGGMILMGFGFAQIKVQPIRSFHCIGCVSPRRDQITEVKYVTIFNADYEVRHIREPWHFGLQPSDRAEIQRRLSTRYIDPHGDPIVYSVVLGEQEWQRIENGELPPGIGWLQNMSKIPRAAIRCSHCGQLLP